MERSLYNLRSKKKKQSPLELESTGSNIGRRDKPKKRPRLLHKCSYVGDQFSKLPDDIITDHILPHLNFKEKVQSSVLSRRWKYLWRYSLGTELLFHRGYEGDSLLCTEWGVGHLERYIQGVDSILTSFSGPKLDHLSIYAFLDEEFNDDLHRWIRLAIGKGLERLHLRLAPRYPQQLAKFPSLKRSLRSSGGVCHLKELSLSYVGIRGDAVVRLLSYCPLLELLSLHSSLCSHLKISGPSLNLKHLEILNCKWSLKVEVSAPNLITLKYDGLNKDFLLSNTPLLENVCMSRFYSDRFLKEVVRLPLQHFCYLHQLKTLEFEMRYNNKIESFPLEPPKLAKLEELKVATLIIPKVRMLWPIGLLKAAPRLKKFAVKQLESSTLGIRTVEELEKMKGATKFMHSCLEVLEVTGYCGNLEVCEMIEGVLSIAATSLERLVIKYDEKETMWESRFRGKRAEMVKLMIRRIESRLPANCRLMLN